MLNLSSNLKMALNNPSVRTFRLYQVFFKPDDWRPDTQYRGVGEIVNRQDVAYRSIAPSLNDPPPTGSGWALAEYPLHFTDWSEDIAYLDEVYKAFPVKCGDIRQGSDGKIEDVTLSIANIGEDRIIQQIVEQYEIIGETVRVMQFFIDPVTDEIIMEPITMTFKVKAAKAIKGQVDFTLSMGFEFLLTTLPNRVVFQGLCRWKKFKDAYCKYTGPDTTCRKTFEDCKAKGNLRNFGGFPAIQNQRFYF